MDNKNIMKDPVYRVSEIFAGFQGEGMMTGSPCVFIRLAGCNLDCSWCDTPQKEEWQEMTSVDIANFATAHALERFGREQVFAVITGGEPTQYDLGPLADSLEDFFTFLALETNGTTSLMTYPDNTFGFVSMSPKPGANIPGENFLLVSEIKIVVDGGPGLHELIEKASAVGCPVWLQPESNRPEMVELAERLVALAPGVCRVGHQMHKLRGWR